MIPDAPATVKSDMFGAMLSKSSTGTLHTHSAGYKFDLDVAGFRWSKRTHMASYPQRLRETLPWAAQQSTRTFIRMMNEAIDAIRPWHPMH